MKAITTIFSLTILANAVMAQCGPYKHHPLLPDTVGFAYVNLNDCGASSCLWDNGSTDQQTDLSVGPHSVILFGSGTPDTLQFMIEQDHWEFDQSNYAIFNGLEIDIWAEIRPHGEPQIFDNPKCRPAPDSTTIFLLQDGIPLDSITPVDTEAGEQHMWNGLTYGHTYQLQLIDNSSCASSTTGELISAFSSGIAQMQVISEDADEISGGSIQVTGITPDPLSPLPPPTPFTGTFMLYQLPDHTPVGAEQTGTMAFWDNLLPGDYDVFFTPDSLCNPSDTVVTIGTSTGITEDRSALGAPMVAWPQPVHDVLHWKSLANGTMRVHDAQGRLVLSGTDHGRLDVSELPDGLYHLQVTQGERVEWTRFLKQ